MKTLDQIAIEKGTDKSSEIHNYCIKYEKYLRFGKEEELKILEIGVQTGSSLRTWQDFYPNSFVVGIDIDPNCAQHRSERIAVEIGSQDDEQFLTSVAEKYGPFDMILDDGSHMQHHMIKSFEIMFKHIKQGGTYIVEDTCCSYWTSHGGSLRSKGSAVEYFKNLIDDVNFYGALCQDFNPSHARREDMLEKSVRSYYPQIRTDIESILFLNSIIILTKR